VPCDVCIGVGVCHFMCVSVLVCVSVGVGHVMCVSVLVCAV